jgi:capsule polysaccharide export protein KpsE/RkpR
MTRETERLAERHVQEFEARLQHADELIAQARREAEGQKDHPDAADSRARLEDLARERDRIAVQLDQLRLSSPEQPGAEEIQAAGPMGIWDALAQQIERLIQRLQR